MAAKEGADILDQVEGGGEEGEVVPALPRQQGGVEQAPHPLRLHLQGLHPCVDHQVRQQGAETGHRNWDQRGGGGGEEGGHGAEEEVELSGGRVEGGHGREVPPTEVSCVPQPRQEVAGHPELGSREGEGEVDVLCHKLKTARAGEVFQEHLN